jgi:hypothetical protein
MNQPRDAHKVSGGAENPTIPRDGGRTSLSITNTASDHARVGAQIGVLNGIAVIRQIFYFLLPRSVRIAVISLVVSVLAGGGGWAAVVWLLPALAPTYKTEFLIDTTAGTTTSDGPETIANSLKTVVENSGDRDALALRSFGGQCGAENNTTQLVDFDTDNRQEITQAASSVREGSKATLLRGIVQAVEDLSKPFAQRAKQVNRIIVVTRHGTDACDNDTAFVEKEIRNRITAAGLAIEFRLIGYQVPDNQHDQLNQIAWCQVVSAPPASTSLDQEFVEDFGRFLPVECLSWTVVEFVGDGVEFGLRVVRQVGSFREVLTQEPVGVLVAAPLPG